MTELPKKVACYWGAEYFAATKGPFPLPSHSNCGSPPAQHRTDPGRASVPSQPAPLEPLARRRICALVAPFEIPSSFRHSAAPSDSTILQDQSENHHTSLAGSIMMIADAALLKARAADVSCAQLGSATRARDTVRSPGRCSFNDMHLFSTPLYITRQAAVWASNHYLLPRLHQGGWPDSLPNYHLVSPSTQGVLYEPHDNFQIS